MPIGRRIRDLVRGLLGTYLIDQRLSEIRDAMRAPVVETSRAAMDETVQARLAAAEARLAALEPLLERLGSLEAQVTGLSEHITYSVVRDVMILNDYGFPLYFFRDDVNVRDYHAGPGLTLEEAQALVEARVAQRRPRPAMELVRDYWATQNPHNHNGQNMPILAALHALGVRADFVDVGANNGDTAVQAAEILATIGAAVHVHSFEPARVCELARANVALNRFEDTVSVHEVAASEFSGFLPMRVLRGHSEGGSLRSGLLDNAIPLAETRLVRAARLDRFLPQDGRSYFLKIDSEGHDAAILRSARGLIEAGRVPAITTEFAPHGMSAADRAVVPGLLDAYALFNMRDLGPAGTFDRFDEVAPAEFEAFFNASLSANYGFTDLLLVSRPLLETEPFQVLRRTYAETQARRAA